MKEGADEDEDVGWRSRWRRTRRSTSRRRMTLR